jgi:hypothetical protein
VIVVVERRSFSFAGLDPARAGRQWSGHKPGGQSLFVAQALVSLSRELDFDNCSAMGTRPKPVGLLGRLALMKERTCFDS